MSYTPGYSAFNPVERRFARAAWRLVGATLAPGIDKERDDDEVRAMTDTALAQLSTTWTYADKSGPVRCRVCPEENSPWNDYDKVTEYLSSSNAKIKQHKDLIGIHREYLDALNHCDKRSNFLLFVKCNNAKCTHCSALTVDAPKFREIISKHGRFPCVVDKGDGSYQNMFEMLGDTDSELPRTDAHRPDHDSSLVCTDDKCKWISMTKNEAQRHSRHFHSTIAPILRQRK